MSTDERKQLAVGMHSSQGGWTQDAWDRQRSPFGEQTEQQQLELAELLAELPTL